MYGESPDVLGVVVVGHSRNDDSNVQPELPTAGGHALTRMVIDMIFLFFAFSQMTMSSIVCNSGSNVKFQSIPRPSKSPSPDETKMTD